MLFLLFHVLKIEHFSNDKWNIEETEEKSQNIVLHFQSFTWLFTCIEYPIIACAWSAGPRA